MKGVVRPYMAVCLRPQHLKRTLTITLLVGTWLTLYNQGDALLSGTISTTLVSKIVLNYLTPFFVSNWGLLSRGSESNH